MKSNAVIAQFANMSNGGKYCNHLCLTLHKTKDYCLKHAIDIEVKMVNCKISEIMGMRFSTTRKLMDEYEYVCLLDADALIVSDAIDFRSIWKNNDCFLGFVEYNIPEKHLNSGMFYVRSSDDTKKVFDEWMNTEPYDYWNEQRTINDLYNSGKYGSLIRKIDPIWNDISYSRMSKRSIVVATHGSNSEKDKFVMMLLELLNHYNIKLKVQL